MVPATASSSRLCLCTNIMDIQFTCAGPVKGRTGEKQNVRLDEWAMIVKWVGRDFSGLDRPLQRTGFILFYFALADSGTQDRRNLPSTQTIHCNATTHVVRVQQPPGGAIEQLTSLQALVLYSVGTDV